VTAFQSGRYDQGGAAAIGWATTADVGGNWRSGCSPGSPRRPARPVRTTASAIPSSRTTPSAARG
jgi:hypothetical protein